MYALARADGKMMLAMAANFQVFVELLVENHRAALRAFGPKTLGDLALLRLGRPQFGLLNKRSGVSASRRWSHGRFRGFQPKGLFRKRTGSHDYEV